MSRFDMPDPNSRLSKIVKYLWSHPDSNSVPDEIMPFDHQVYYIFNQVKDLRYGTDLPELTLEELERIMLEEFPNWREASSEELPDWFLQKHGMERPIIKGQEDEYAGRT